MMGTADYYISQLGLQEHVEGGYFKEIYKNPQKLNGQDLAVKGERLLSSSIYYLLKSGQYSKFHQLLFDEIWLFHMGSPLTIHMIDGNGELKSSKLGIDIDAGEMPQLTVPAGAIFAAEVIQDNSFSLVSCVTAPGFDYEDFRIYSEEELIKRFPKHKAMITKFNGK
ncbi:MAG TPA: cupin domain-containing protein [Bacillota bacterium]|jgi:predicted cupin superfamily sugar epimerase|nr:cupin domain-containing protein [Bacillota bacterium]